MMTQAHLQGYARTDAAAGLPLAAARRTARALDREWGRGTGATYLGAFRAASHVAEQMHDCDGCGTRAPGEGWPLPAGWVYTADGRELCPKCQTDGA